MWDFDKIYRENTDLVSRYLFSMTHDADLSEELTQQTFCAALYHPGNFRGESALSTYLCGIAKNLMKREFARREKARCVPLKEAVPDPTVRSVETQVIETAGNLFARIHRLPDNMREVVYLRLAGELSFCEIGSILGRSETWARVTFYRAKQKLMEGGV